MDTHTQTHNRTGDTPPKKICAYLPKIVICSAICRNANFRSSTDAPVSLIFFFCTSACVKCLREYCRVLCTSNFMFYFFMFKNYRPDRQTDRHTHTHTHTHLSVIQTEDIKAKASANPNPNPNPNLTNPADPSPTNRKQNGKIGDL